MLAWKALPLALLLGGCQDVLEPGTEGAPTLPPGPATWSTTPSEGGRRVFSGLQNQDPDVSGTRISWTTFVSDYDVHYADLATGEVRPIATGPNHQYFSAIDGDRVVWVEEIDGAGEIRMHDLGTGEVRTIAAHPAHDTNPEISGDRVVWATKRNGSWDIYLHDLTTGETRPIASGPHDEINPSISGTRVVWSDNRSNRGDIYLFDLATGEERRITTAGSYEDVPSISGDRVVWITWYSANDGVYVYDIPTGERMLVERATSTFPVGQPRVSGNDVVWMSYRNKRWDIYHLDLATGKERALAYGPAGQTHPSIDGRYVVVGVAGGHVDLYDLDAAPADDSPPVVTYALTGTLGEAGWYTSTVTLTWSVQEPESPGSLVKDGCANQVISADQPETAYSCTATSDGGSTGPVTVRIKRDATAPRITYTGNAGRYTVDQRVQIACSAVDDTSGLDQDCDGTDELAYTFPAGATTLSATVVDRAGNPRTGSTSFEVQATYGSLCTVVRTVVTSADVAAGLCDKLAAMEQAAARSNANAKSGALKAFTNQVEAQTGKAVPAVHAAMLLRWVGTL